MKTFWMKLARDAATEGSGGASSTGDAAAKAAEAKAAEEAVAKAKADADAAAAAAAANTDNPELKKLAEEKADLLKEVMDKKSKLKAAQEAEAQAKKALEAYEGVDPAKVKELLRKEAEAERLAAEAKGDFERVKQMMAEEHAKEKKTLEQQIADLTAKLSSKDSVIDELTIGNSFANSPYIKDSLILSPEKTRQLYGQHFEMKDGKLVGYNKPVSAADKTLLVNSAGDPLPFEEALERIVEGDPDKKSVLKSKSRPGSASSTTSSAAAAAQTTTQSKAEGQGLYGRTRLAAALKGAI